MKKRTTSAIAALAAGTLLLAGCASGGSNSSGGSEGGDPVIIGASLPLTGPLQAFGTTLELGYEQAINEVNEAGGIEIDGALRTIELVVQDNASNGDKAAEQARSLVLDDGAVALLGPATPPLSIPVSAVADQLRVPALISITPLQAWKGGNPDGWTYAWDVFFDELQQTQTQFQAADLVETNKKVALFTDNAEDGTVMGALWEDKAAEFGYEVAYRATFPVGTTDYTQYINELKASDADVLIAQMIPPDAMALWKQLKAADVDLQLAFAEKAASTSAWPGELGEIAEGTMITDWFLPGDPKGEELLTQFSAEVGTNPEATAAILAYSAAMILVDAIERAGSTDPAAINDAIAETSTMIPSGYQIEFGDDHASRIEPVSSQWVGPDTLQIFPQVEGVSLVVPVAGLQ